MFLQAMSFQHQSRTLLALAGIASGLGCVPGADPARQQTAELTTGWHTSGGLTFAVAVPPDLDEACPKSRFIGEHSAETGTCPAAAGYWRVAPLFTGSTAHPVPGGLARYCVYQWDGPAGSSPLIGLLPKDGHPSHEDWLSPDCNVVAPMSGALTSNYWPALEQSFREQVSRIDTLPAGGAPIRPVRIDVVDTSTVVAIAGSVPGSGESLHGRAMGLIIEHLACPGGACAAEVAHSLALPLDRAPGGGLERDYRNGGLIGSYGDISRAIFGAVSRWKQHQPGRGLIINLSVGWSPVYGGDFTGSFTNLSPAVRSVYEAISHAVCEGALVIAASGNAGGGPLPPSGPIYPARWETRPRPTLVECAEFSDAPVRIAPTGAVPGQIYQPLLFSASGLDGSDQVLANAPASSRARIAAPASHVTVADPTHVHTRVMTGSSVAAAVTSAAAAVVWAYHPGLAPVEVMQLVYAAGAPLSVAADYCQGAYCGGSRRVSICAALRGSCALLGGAYCPASVVCDARSASETALPPPPDLTGLIYSATASASVAHGWRVPTPCNAVVLSSSSSGPENPCPAEQLFSMSRAPWADPQPDADPCPDCLCMEYRAILEISSDFEGTLSSPTLTFKTMAGDFIKLDLSPEVPEMRPGEIYEIGDLPLRCDDVAYGTADFVVDDLYSASSELLIYR